MYVYCGTVKHAYDEKAWILETASYKTQKARNRIKLLTYYIPVLGWLCTRSRNHIHDYKWREAVLTFFFEEKLFPYFFSSLAKQLLNLYFCLTLFDTLSHCWMSNNIETASLAPCTHLLLCYIGNRHWKEYKGCNSKNGAESINLWPHLGDGVSTRESKLNT